MEQRLVPIGPSQSAHGQVSQGSGGVLTQLRIVFIGASVFRVLYCIDASLNCFSRNSETFLQLGERCHLW
jgi:hypothetical protein